MFSSLSRMVIDNILSSSSTTKQLSTMNHLNISNKANKNEKKNILRANHVKNVV